MRPTEPRRARVKALAKINLSLKVLHQRPDGFHELRTIFQTISLGDTLDIAYVPSARTSIDLESEIAIEDNLVVRAARCVMEEAGIRGQVQFRLRKRIPIGGGLGGGSSDAAAVLLALPVLAGRSVPLEKLTELAAGLGSDVPFFLTGGTVLGMGRGTELYPLPEVSRFHGVAVFPPFRISTVEAYRGLRRQLTEDFESITMTKFQAFSWKLACGLMLAEWAAFAENDFEASVEERYPELATIRRKLARCGAKPVMLSGSGSSIFGIFPESDGPQEALKAFQNQDAAIFQSVNRSQYRRMWWRSLQQHIEGESWPPQSRYAR